MKDVVILMERTSEFEVKDLAPKLPSDLHLIEYEIKGELHIDGVRATAMVDVFDFYHDWLSEESDAFSILSIKSGYGTINPRNFGNQQEEEDL